MTKKKLTIVNHPDLDTFFSGIVTMLKEAFPGRYVIMNKAETDTRIEYHIRFTQIKM